MDRTHDQDMGLGEHMPKPTIPVVDINAVPRAIGVDTSEGVCGGRPLNLKDTRLRCVRRLGVAVELAFQLG
jgi:hypothetical protein